METSYLNKGFLIETLLINEGLRREAHRTLCKYSNIIKKPNFENRLQEKPENYYHNSMITAMTIHDN